MVSAFNWIERWAGVLPDTDTNVEMEKQTANRKHEAYLQLSVNP